MQILTLHALWALKENSMSLVVSGGLKVMTELVLLLFEVEILYKVLHVSYLFSPFFLSSVKIEDFKFGELHSVWRM